MNEKTILEIQIIVLTKKREKIRLYKTEIVTKNKIDSASTLNSLILFIDSLIQIHAIEKYFPDNVQNSPYFPKIAVLCK